MFLDVTGLERVYLASLSAGWSMALHFALRYPARLEGLVLIAAHSAAMDARPEVLALEARLPEITAPTLVLIEERVRAALPSVDVLKERLPRCTQVVMPESSLSPSAHTPTLQLGHTIMHFLLHCERQRNLVRGASFLL
jgi:pimeloyl-ACP methyl ester carboxylesterase